LSLANWDLKISGYQVFTNQTQGSTASGNLGFRKSGEADVALQMAGTGTVGNWFCAGDTVTNVGGAMGSLTGKLVFRHADGTAFLAVAGSGELTVRGKVRTYAF
jgi:hypothetical protein